MFTFNSYLGIIFILIGLIVRFEFNIDVQKDIQ